MVQEI